MRLMDEHDYARFEFEHFPRYWPFVRGIHRLPVNSSQKGKWRGALTFSLICALNKRLSKQSWGWWFFSKRLNNWHASYGRTRLRKIWIWTFSALLALRAGNSPVTGEFLSERQVTRNFDVFFLSAPWINGWVNNREAGDLRRHSAHYDVIAMPYANIATVPWRI